MPTHPGSGHERVTANPHGLHSPKSIRDGKSPEMVSDSDRLRAAGRTSGGTQVGGNTSGSFGHEREPSNENFSEGDKGVESES